MLAKGKVNKFC